MLLCLFFLFLMHVLLEQNAISEVVILFFLGVCFYIFPLNYLFFSFFLFILHLFWLRSDLIFFFLPDIFHH